MKLGTTFASKFEIRIEYSELEMGSDYLLNGIMTCAVLADKVSRLINHSLPFVYKTIWTKTCQDSWRKTKGLVDINIIEDKYPISPV